MFSFSKEGLGTKGNRKEGDLMELEQMISKYSDFIKGIVKPYKYKMNFTAYDYEDLYQEAILGFIEAYNKFKGEESEFKAYARIAIQNRLKDLIVFQSNKIKFPHKYAKIWKVADEHNWKIEDSEEIANILGLPIRTVIEAMNWKQSKNIDSLERLETNANGEYYRKYENRNSASSDLSQLIVRDFLERLDDETKAIIILRMDGLTQKEISKLVGKSRIKVCRTILKTAEKLEIYVME